MKTFAPRGLQQHPLSAAFPRMTEAEFAELKASIGMAGVQTPIVLFEGQVLDGWHRYTVCHELGVDCPCVELPDGVNPRDFVLAQNHARRNLTASQKALAVAAVYAWAPVGRPNNSAPGAELKPTVKAIAEKEGVGTRNLERAKKVLTDAAPEVVEAVRSGEVSVKRAADVARLPKNEQAQALAEPSPTPVRAGVSAKFDAPCDDADAPDLHTLVQELSERNDVLEQMVASLNTSDLAAEIVRLTTALQGAEVQRNRAMDKVADMDRALRHHGKLFDRLRKAAGADDNAQAVSKACMVLEWSAKHTYHPIGGDSDVIDADDIEAPEAAHG